MSYKIVRAHYVKRHGAPLYARTLARLLYAVESSTAVAPALQPGSWLQSPHASSPRVCSACVTVSLWNGTPPSRVD
eukprot:3332388-Prymnesium_polylepis.1